MRKMIKEKIDDDGSGKKSLAPAFDQKNTCRGRKNENNNETTKLTLEPQGKLVILSGIHF